MEGDIAVDATLHGYSLYRILRMLSHKSHRILKPQVRDVLLIGRSRLRLKIL